MDPARLPRQTNLRHRAVSSGLLKSFHHDSDRARDSSLRGAQHPVNGCEKPALCFDILRHQRRPVITEISYYFNAPSIRECPGHWREGHSELEGELKGELEWVEGSTHAEDAVLDDFLARMTSFRNKS